jgi:hypothetical protein
MTYEWMGLIALWVGVTAYAAWAVWDFNKVNNHDNV